MLHSKLQRKFNLFKKKCCFFRSLAVSVRHVLHVHTDTSQIKRLLGFRKLRSITLTLFCAQDDNSPQEVIVAVTFPVTLSFADSFIFLLASANMGIIIIAYCSFERKGKENGKKRAHRT